MSKTAERIRELHAAAVKPYASKAEGEAAMLAIDTYILHRAEQFAALIEAAEKVVDDSEPFFTYSQRDMKDALAALEEIK